MDDIEVPKPAEEREYNVQMPKEQWVYYDTILDQTMTVIDIDQDEEFVTYAVENGPDNMQSDPMPQFLASLASGRFIKLGSRIEARGIDAPDKEIANVFTHAYGYDPRDFRPMELARFLLSERLDETLVIDNG